MMALSEGSPESLTEIHQLSPRCVGCVMVTLRGRISFSSTQSTTARSGGFMYNPTMSRTLSRNNGSLDNLKVSSSHGLRPNAFQMRLIVGWDITPKYGRDSEPSRLGHQGEVSRRNTLGVTIVRRGGLRPDGTLGTSSQVLEKSSLSIVVIGPRPLDLARWEVTVVVSGRLFDHYVAALDRRRQGLVDCSDVGRLTSQKGANKANETSALRIVEASPV